MEWISEKSQRLDAEVKRGAKLSNRKARQAIRTGKIRLDGQRILDPAQRVRVGQRLSLNMAAPNPARTEPLGSKLIYRDDHLLVLDKPAGLLSAPIPNSEEPSALHAAARLCKGPRRPRVLHRLDKLTSGLLLFARSIPSTRALRRAFEAHEIERVYRCVTQGAPQAERGVISSMLLRDAGQGRRGSRRESFRCRAGEHPNPEAEPGRGKLAITRYRRCTQSSDQAALELRLSTGRTHQIRIHLAELGCPVLGERVYARPRFKLPRFALHAALLAFQHPCTGRQLRFESPWPEELSQFKIVPHSWYPEGSRRR